ALWRRFDQYDPSQPFVPWACRFAFRHVLKYRQKKARVRKLLSVEILNQLARDRVEHDDFLESRRHALAKCLQRLTDEEPALIAERYARRANLAQLAEATGRKVSALYKALERVRRKLFECVNRGLKQEGGH